MFPNYHETEYQPDTNDTVEDSIDAFFEEIPVYNYLNALLAKTEAERRRRFQKGVEASLGAMEKLPYMSSMMGDIAVVRPSVPAAQPSQLYAPPPEGAGKSYSGKAYGGTRNQDVDFSDKKGNSTLTRHFNDHNGDFTFKLETDYLNGSRNFLEKPPTSTTQSFVSSDGTYFRYDTATNEFGIMNKYGGVSTYFKPSEGINYWLKQISDYAPK